MPQRVEIIRVADGARDVMLSGEIQDGFTAVEIAQLLHRGRAIFRALPDEVPAKSHSEPEGEAAELEAAAPVHKVKKHR